MVTRTFAALIAALTCFLFIGGCAKYDKPGFLSKPGIALTFDDNYVDDWYKYINFFDSMDVKVTFYISNYRHFSNEQKSKLHELQAHGHEIAYHSVNHPDFLKYLQHHRMEELQTEEIDNGMQLMNADGFYPVTFAYPYGSHNEVLDKVLLKKFKSVRALNGTKDYTRSFCPTSHNDVLYGIGMDVSSGKTTEQLVDLVQLAKQNNDCLVLVGHHIERKNLKMQVPYDRLKILIQTARALNLEFYTASQISIN